MKNAEVATAVDNGFRLPPTENWCVLLMVDLSFLTNVPRSPHAMYELMLRCWSENPDDRPSFAAIVDEIVLIAKTSSLDSVSALKDRGKHAQASHIR